MQTATSVTGEISNIHQLTKYIRGMLGEPLIQVELTDDHIYQIIFDTVKVYTDVAYGFMDDIRLHEINPDLPFNKIRMLDLDEVTNVTKTDGKTKVDFKWDSIKRVLHLNASGVDKVMIFGQQRYQIDHHFDLIFNESWVKDFAKAKTQLLWGQVLGKYSQSLVGGATINFDRLISEAQSDIERLLEELHEKWMDPAPVLVV